MGDIDIQKQIDDRKVQAVERRIFEKGVHAAYHLGEGHRDVQRHTQGGRETHLIYQDQDAGAGLTLVFSRVTYSDPRHSTYETLEILEGEGTVFLQKDVAIEGYIPGDWEAELEKLQRPAERAKETMAQATEQEQQAAESERGAKLRKAWGLASEDGRTRGTDPPKPRLGGVVERPQRRRR